MRAGMLAVRISTKTDGQDLYRMAEMGTDVVVCQVEISRQEGKSGKSVDGRTEADRSQSVFCEGQVEDRSIMRHGLVLQLKDE